VRFGSEEFIRVGSLKKKLKDYPSKEAELWASFSKNPFEHGIAKADLPGDELLSLLDFAGCFDLLGIPLPTDQRGSVSRLAEENLVVRTPGGRFDITNLGAILFAKNLNPVRTVVPQGTAPTHKSCKLGEFDNTCHCRS
jgi:ATP-dependent DNA helicase RecG